MGRVYKLSLVKVPVWWHQEAREEGVQGLGGSLPPSQHVNQRNTTPTPLPSATAQAVWRGLRGPCAKWAPA